MRRYGVKGEHLACLRFSGVVCFALSCAVGVVFRLSVLLREPALPLALPVTTPPAAADAASGADDASSLGAPLEGSVEAALAQRRRGRGASMGVLGKAGFTKAEHLTHDGLARRVVVGEAIGGVHRLQSILCKGQNGVPPPRGFHSSSSGGCTSQYTTIYSLLTCLRALKNLSHALFPLLFVATSSTTDAGALSSPDGPRKKKSFPKPKPLAARAPRSPDARSVPVLVMDQSVTHINRPWVHTATPRRAAPSKHRPDVGKIALCTPSGFYRRTNARYRLFLIPLFVPALLDPRPGPPTGQSLPSLLTIFHPPSPAPRAPLPRPRPHPRPRSPLPRPPKRKSFKG